MKLKLVQNWRDGKKWISSNCMALAIAVEGSWLALPSDLKTSIPAEYVTYISLALVVAGFIGRFIDQGQNDNHTT